MRFFLAIILMTTPSYAGIDFSMSSKREESRQRAEQLIRRVDNMRAVMDIAIKESKPEFHDLLVDYMIATDEMIDALEEYNRVGSSVRIGVCTCDKNGECL